MIVVIPTAGLATRMLPLSHGIPKALVPHHDRPILHHILSSYLDIPVTKVVIVIAPRDRDLFEPLCYLYRFSFVIELVEQPQPRGLLDAFLCAWSHLGNTTEPVTVQLGDSIFSNRFIPSEFEKSFVAVTPVAASEVSHWCMVEVENGIAKGFIDKPQKSGSTAAISGLYYFSQPDALAEAVQAIQQDTHALEAGNISALLLAYGEIVALAIQWRSDWCDMGNLSHMHRHYFDHHFAHHQVKQIGTQIMKSGDSEAMQSESYYYQHLLVPSAFPRLDQVKSAQILMSYVSAHSLAYYFLWQSIPVSNREYIVSQLWQWLGQNFYIHKPKVSRAVASTEWMYGERILKRIHTWQSQLSDTDQHVVFTEKVMVNGHVLEGWPSLQKLILKRAKQLAQTANIRHIHGDLHCANILYDPERHIFTLIDPRGAWGKKHSIWGDIRYDMAKFLHSFHGGYEYIKNRLSLFEESVDGSYTLTFPESKVDNVKWLDDYCSQWSIAKDDVLWIEGLCLLAISGFYQDSALQKQFFLQGLLLLNSLL